jgi:hypothetical protein
VARALPHDAKAAVRQRADAIAAGHARQFGHTATTIVSKRSSGIGRRSSSSAATYS